MPDCLHHAIDQLTTRGVVPEEIAEIVEVESEQVRAGSQLWEGGGRGHRRLTHFFVGDASFFFSGDVFFFGGMEVGKGFLWEKS